MSRRTARNVTLGYFGRHCGPALCSIAAILIVGLTIGTRHLPHAWGQVAVLAVPAKAEGPASNKAVERGFSIAFDDRLADSLTKFEELAQSHSWEKAFRLLADIADDKWSAMLPNATGFIRPASQRVRDVILQLPADGREAYRIFFDAKARILFDSARTAQKEEDARIAKTIYDRYFITSVGDDAADRVADDYFERGQFADAAACWKAVFEFHPDTNLGEARLLVKRAIALHRAGAKDEFQNVRQQLECDFPGAKVVLGGAEVDAVAYLNKLEAQASKAAPPGPKPPVERPVEFTGTAPRDDVTPAWQYRFLDEKDWTALRTASRNYYGAPQTAPIVPAAASDGHRLYCNWMGAVFAIDLGTGKLAWSHTDPKSAVSRLRANDGRSAMLMRDTGRFGIAIGEGVVLGVVASPGQADRYRLVALDAVSGKVVWTTESGALNPFSFAAAPMIDGSQVLAITNQPGTTNALVLRNLDLRTGNELWNLTLGTPQLVGNADWGQQRMPVPALHLARGRLYVLTNDGALLAVNVVRRELEWAFKYESPGANGNGNPRGFNTSVAASTYGDGMIDSDGILYFKENGSPTLFAVDENGPSLKWKWQDSLLADLVGVDDQNVYLFSDEITALKRSKPEILWSNRLSIEAPGLGANLGSRALLVFTPRGLFELSKTTGDVQRIFRGADMGSSGGRVIRAGQRLVCVSNMAVTAYPEPSER